MMWKKDIWIVKHTLTGNGYITVCVEFQSKIFFFMNVYAPCNTPGRRLLWEKDASLIGEWCFMGDFNVVSSLEERAGRTVYWRNRDMEDFNVVVNEMNLIDPPLYGKKFTYFCSDDIVTSRLDRFLVSRGIINAWKIKGQRVGNRDISDHCPIWLACSNQNWGPKPFRFNSCWIDHEGFKSFVIEEWNKL